MSEQPEYNALDPELEARMRAKREASRRMRELESDRGPRRFANYELLELLGEGPAAKVYRARGPSGETVALKCLRTAVVAGVERPGAREAFLDAHVAALVAARHPHLLPVLGVVADGERRALALELREEETLDALLRRRPALPWREALRIASALADGLEVLPFAHDDVKPRNVLVGEDGAVLLMDPSSAREVDAAGGDRAIALAGSPQYMAPERLRGAAGSARGDVYSLGCVLFQMLSGRLPYKGPLVAQLRAGQEAGQRNALRSPLAPPPAAVIELLTQMLEVDPARRPEPAELRRRLRAALELDDAEVETAGARRTRMIWIGVAIAAFVVLLVLRSR